MTAYLRFWGKRSRVDGLWHPAAYHCLDVAASAVALVETNRHLRRELSELLGLDGDLVGVYLASWLALHDIGKMSAPFHAQVSRLWLPEMLDITTVSECVVGLGQAPTVDVSSNRRTDIATSAQR